MIGIKKKKNEGVGLIADSFLFVQIDIFAIKTRTLMQIIITGGCINEDKNNYISILRCGCDR